MFHLDIMASELASAIAACGQIIDTSNPIPILKAVRISVENGAAHFLGTNSDQTISLSRAAEGSGVACIDIALLTPKISVLDQSRPASFEGDGKTVTLRQGKAKWIIPVLLDDFPLQVADPPKGEEIDFDASFLGALVTAEPATLKSASNNYSGVWLTGGFVVAVDGKRMRIIETGHDVGSYVIPPAAIQRAAALFKSGGKMILTRQAGQFSSETVRLKSRFADMEPSPWRPTFDKWQSECVNECLVDASQLLSAARRAAAIRASGEKSGSFINMQLRFRRSEIEIFTRNLNGEEGSDIVEAQGSADVDVGFNGGMLLDDIATLSGRIRIRYGENRHQIIMEPEKSDRMNARVAFPRMFT